MTCREVITLFLADYVANELPPERRAELERHFALCASCAAYLATYESTIRLARGAYVELDDLPEELVRAILRR